MQLFATIHQVSTGEHDQPKIHFSLHDGEDTQCVSFLDTIGLAHATFLIEHDIVEGDSGYARMLNAFVDAEDPASLVGIEFGSSHDDVEHGSGD